MIVNDVVFSEKEETGVHIFWRAGQACQLSPWDPRPRRNICKASKPFIANLPSWSTQRKMSVFWQHSRLGCYHFTRSWQNSVCTREAENGCFRLGWQMCSFFIKGLRYVPVPCACSRDLNFNPNSCCKHRVKLSLVNSRLILLNILLVIRKRQQNLDPLWIQRTKQLLLPEQSSPSN